MAGASTAQSTPVRYTEFSPQVTHRAVYPPSLKFQQGETSSLPLWTDRARINPRDGPQSYSPTSANNRIRFKFDQLLYDLRPMVLEVDISTSGPGGGVTQWLCHDARSVFKVVRVLATNNPVEEQFDAHKVLALKSENMSAAGVEAAFGANYGAMPLAARQAAGATTTKYMLPLDVNLFKRGPFPVFLMEEDMQLELELAPVQEVMESSAALTTQTYTLANMTLHCKLIESAQYRDTMQYWLMAGGMDFGFKTFEVIRTAPTTVSTPSIQVPARQASIDCYLMVLKPQGFDTNIQNVDKLLTWSRVPAGGPATTIVTAQMRIYGKLWPRQPFQLVGVQATNMYQELGHLWGWDYKSLVVKEEFAPILPFATFDQGNRFQLLFDTSHLLTDHLISRASTDSQVVDPVFDLVFDNTTPSMVTDVFMLYYRTCKLSPGGLSGKGRWEVPKK